MKKKVLAINGSTRTASANGALLQAITQLSSGRFDIHIFSGLEDIPIFNPDKDSETAVIPPTVSAFRKLINEATAVIICTPEYAIGVPGALKNAIDWTVSAMNFSNKPVALITASLGGYHAHNALLGTLLIIEAKINAETQLLISGIKGKLKDNSTLDDTTKQAIDKLISSLYQLIDGDETGLLVPPPMTQPIQLHFKP